MELSSLLRKKIATNLHTISLLGMAEAIQVCMATCFLRHLH